MIRPDGRPTRRWLATLAVLLALISALWWNQNRGLRAITDDLSHQALQNCQEIERLNQRVRNNAIENFRKLDENGRLLGITITPELRAAALADRNSILKHYAPRHCPR